MKLQVRKLRGRRRMGLTIAVFASVIVTANPAPPSAAGNQIMLAACSLVMGLVLAIAAPFDLTAAWFGKLTGPEPIRKPTGAGAGNNLPVFSPLDGTAIPLSEVSDVAFADGDLCQGLAILPRSGFVFSPFDATVVVVSPTGRAMKLRHANGVEVLIQIGVDNVDVNCALFSVKVRSSQHVKAGDCLVEFHHAALAAAGDDAVTRVTVLNLDLYPQVVPMASGPISHGEILFMAIAAENCLDAHVPRG